MPAPSALCRDCSRLWRALRTGDEFGERRPLQLELRVNVAAKPVPADRTAMAHLVAHEQHC